MPTMEVRFNPRYNQPGNLISDELRKGQRLVSLHTDVDEGSEWGFYEAERRAHLDMCKELNFTLIYVATGSRQDTEQLRSEAQHMGISVISKVDLLSKIEKQSDFDTLAFESLSIAQKNALDFEILSRSSFYSGPADVSCATINFGLSSSVLPSPVFI